MILDARCGTGRWIRHLAPLGYRMALSDLSPVMIAYARKKADQAGWGDQIAEFYALDICDMHPYPTISSILFWRWAAL